MMTNAKLRRPLVLERSYEATVEELWELWTTKEGFEAWWGPVGFRVDVHAIEPRVGGALRYDMIAVGEREIAAMKEGGMPLSHGTHGTFVEVVHLQRLKMRHVIDFIPGVDAYDNDMTVEFFAAGSTARMVITVDPHIDEDWTRKSVAGMTSQLTKIPDVLASRRK